MATGSGQSCKSYESVELDGTEGYIGNVVTEGTGYGTSFCPWKIKLAPGQKINITLYDFGVLRYNKESPICQVRDLLLNITRKLNSFTNNPMHPIVLVDQVPVT